MLSLFKTKKHFVDIWAGTPDLHCHVLPGIDDGAKNIEDSLTMLSVYKDIGCNSIIATPHIMEGIYDNDKKTIGEALIALKERTKGMILLVGAEYMLDNLFKKSLKEDTVISFGDRYVLVEMSYFQPPENLKDLLFLILSKGYKPILAHPERYSYYHKEIGKLLEIKELGCAFQLNALSLCGHYGTKTKDIALELLKNQKYDYVGTDAHRVDHLNKLSTMLIPKKYEKSLQEVCLKTKAIVG